MFYDKLKSYMEAVKKNSTWYMKKEKKKRNDKRLTFAIYDHLVISSLQKEHYSQENAV